MALSKLNGTEYTNTKVIPNSLPGVSLHILSSSQWEAGTVHAQKSIRCSQPAQSLLLAQQHCSTGFEDDIQWRNATRNGPESVPATEASRQVGGSTCWEHANAARNAPQSRHQLLKHRARSEAPRAGNMQMPREMRPGSIPAAEASSQVGGSTCWEHANASRNRSEAPRAGSRVGTSCWSM